MSTSEKNVQEEVKNAEASGAGDGEVDNEFFKGYPMSTSEEEVKPLPGKEVETREKALQHAIAWTIQHIYNVNKEALEIVNDKEMSEKDKMERLRGPQGTDYQLLNLSLLLKPMLKFAKEEYSDQENFFSWFDEKWKVIVDNKLIQGECLCKGCKE